MWIFNFGGKLATLANSPALNFWASIFWIGFSIINIFDGMK